MAMGKLSRKIKSDKINMLRKQYDSYLEEEKMRKERNKFILEKLNKISSCNSLLPIRYSTCNISSEAIRSDQRELLKLKNNPTSKQELSTNFYSNCLNETLISEISKNYILIPKNKNNVATEYVRIPGTIDDQSDWKSKYDILNQLKQNELNQSEKDNKLLCNVNNFGKISDETILKQKENNLNLHDFGNNKPIMLKNEKNISEKSVSDNNQSYESYSIHTTRHLTPESLIKENDGEEVEKQDTEYKDDQNVLSKKQKNQATYDNPKINFENTETGINYDNSKDLQNNPSTYYVSQSQLSDDLNLTVNIDSLENKPVKEVNQLIEEMQGYDSNYVDEKPTNIRLESRDHNFKIAEELKYLSQTEHDPLNDQYLPSTANLVDANNENAVAMDNNDTSRNEVRNDTEIKNCEIAGVENIDNNIQDAPEYPIDTINVKDFTNNDGDKLLEGVNINPEGHFMASNDLNSTPQYDSEYTGVVETENDVHSAEKETLNTEQNQMFYSEQQNENYEAYNVENSEANHSGQNENYDNYQYYENGQTDNNYVPEVNQYEESPQEYGPNYEQQYIDQFEQKQQEEYVEPPQYDYETNEQALYPDQEQQQFAEPSQFEYERNEEMQYSDQNHQELLEPTQYEYAEQEQSNVHQYNAVFTENLQNDGQQPVENKLDNNQDFAEVDNSIVEENLGTKPTQ